MAGEGAGARGGAEARLRTRRKEKRRERQICRIRWPDRGGGGALWEGVQGCRRLASCSKGCRDVRRAEGCCRMRSAAG